MKTSRVPARDVPASDTETARNAARIMRPGKNTRPIVSGKNTGRKNAGRVGPGAERNGKT